MSTYNSQFVIVLHDSSNGIRYDNRSYQQKYYFLVVFPSIQRRPRSVSYLDTGTYFSPITAGYLCETPEDIQRYFFCQRVRS